MDPPVELVEQEPMRKQSLFTGERLLLSLVYDVASLGVGKGAHGSFSVRILPSQGGVRVLPVLLRGQPRLRERGQHALQLPEPSREHGLQHGD